MAVHSEDFLRKARLLGRALNALSVLSPALAGRLAFRVFCMPRRLPVREKDAAFLATAAQSDFETEEGLSIRTYRWPAKQSSAPTVFLMHGWESNSARWRKYVKALHEAGFEVQALDAPASGYSDGRLLNVLLLSRVLKAFFSQKGAPHAVVAHSLGGAAAVMNIALLGAPRPKKMVLLGVFAESSRVIEDFANLLTINQKTRQAILLEIERRSKLPISEYSVAKKSALLHDVQGFVLHDRHDEVAPVEEGRAVARAWNARYLETEGLGHRMQDKSVIQAVVEFLQ
jgi:alpha-beta hydrolase superfamily lysophospholipase